MKGSRCHDSGVATGDLVVEGEESVRVKGGYTYSTSGPRA